MLVFLNDPDKFFARVVEIEFDFVGCTADGLITCELYLFDKVLVGDLSKTSSFICIQINIVHKEGSGFDEGETETVE